MFSLQLAGIGLIVTFIIAVLVGDEIHSMIWGVRDFFNPTHRALRAACKQARDRQYH